MFLLRLMANMIDLVVFALIFFGLFFLLSLLTPTHYYEQELLHWGVGVAWLALMIVVPFGVQYPFMRQGQTVGKAFFTLQVRYNENQEPAGFMPMLHREVLAKLMSCYIMCVPVLLRKPATYDKAMDTTVVLKRRG